jgi:hypothetical protein
MSTRVKLLTGPGTSAEQWGMNATDLGIVRRTGKTPENPAGFNLYTFGDTFDQYVGGPGWRSPVSLRSPAYSAAQLNSGINFDSAVGGGRAKQVLPYEHGVGFSTVLPTDLWQIREYLFMHVMVIGFNGLDDVLWTEMHYSLNHGDTWAHAGDGGKRGGNEHAGMFRMFTCEWDAATGWCYAMTSGGLARNKGVFLWRFRDHQSTDKAAWESWGYANGSWGWGKAPSNIMPQGVTVGELNLRKVQGQWLFTYFETAPQSRIVTKVLTAPNANIAAAPTYTIVTNTAWELDWYNQNNTLPQLYGGYLVDGSTLDEPHYVVSQWRNPSPSNWPYRSVQFKGPKLNPVNPVTA